MTVKLFDTADITAIADAIRAQDGSTDMMTVQQMPGKISRLYPQSSRECILEKPDTLPTSAAIDLGIQVDFNGRLEVTARTPRGLGSAPCSAYISNSARYGVHLLGGSNKSQVFWGDQFVAVEFASITGFDVNNEITISVNKSGAKFTQSGRTHTISFTAGNAATNTNWKLFWYNNNTSYNRGIVRRVRFFDSSDNLVWEFVPVITSNFSVAVLQKNPDGENVRSIYPAAGYLAMITTTL